VIPKVTSQPSRAAGSAASTAPRKRLDVADQMVARHHQHRRVGGREQGRERDRRSGIARRRLQHQGGGRDPDLAELPLHLVRMRGARDDDRRALHSERGHLQHRPLAGQRQQLLGALRHRQGPQPRPRPAGKDDWNDL
jgi:hypothetical protein